jgi:hypothetical protein
MSSSYGRIGNRYYFTRSLRSAPRERTARLPILPCPLCGLRRANLKIHTGSALCLKARAKQLQAKEKAA